ncbi:MAG: hypothetical protein AAF639_14185 [Chloroflexota bacterium]
MMQRLEVLAELTEEGHITIPKEYVAAFPQKNPFQLVLMFDPTQIDDDEPVIDDVLSNGEEGEVPRTWCDPPETWDELIAEMKNKPTPPSQIRRGVRPSDEFIEKILNEEYIPDDELDDSLDEDSQTWDELIAEMRSNPPPESQIRRAVRPSD